MSIALIEDGNDLLYRYLSREQFKKQAGFYHSDPLIDEFSYGEGGGFSAFVWNHVNVGSRIFFHTTIGGTRYLTAMYVVSDFAPAAVWRADDRMRKKYRNPHLHPEENPDWWGDHHSEGLERKVRAAYKKREIYTDVDIVILGDSKKSVDIRKAPIVLDKQVLSRLRMKGKPIKWDIVDKHGKTFEENRCITSCLRVPRVISSSDGDLLEGLVRRSAARAKGEKSFMHVQAIDSFLASRLELQGASEDEIEKSLIRRLDSIEKGLRFINNQVGLESGGRIDILAERKDGTPVLIEIKKGTADDRTLTQLVSYLHAFRAKNPKCEPVGKIVCGDASARLRSACEHLKIDIHCYGEVFLRNE
jgi:hypothetical protein